MIVSHRHRFIFLKPKKVAGTSIEIALAQQCGDNDIVTPITEFSKEQDESYYIHEARNHEGGFYNHMTPGEIIDKLEKDTWDNYLKFTVVRNPWDYLVSRYHWDVSRIKNQAFTPEGIKRNLLRPKAYRNALMLLFSRTLRKGTLDDFNEYVKHFSGKQTNQVYYFDSDGVPLADYYMRYEDLEEDYGNLCEKIGIPFSPLPRTKSRLRNSKKHYSEYYNDESCRKVEEMCSREIEYFGYCFEQDYE